VEARGVAVANSLRAKASGVSFDLEKSMEEKDVRPDVTSGTLERVFAVAEQVTVFWREVATSATSAGSAVLPTRKQAAFWRELRGEAEVRARRERRVMVVECIVAVMMNVVFEKSMYDVKKMVETKVLARGCC
jgi:hypothetical protein